MTNLTFNNWWVHHQPVAFRTPPEVFDMLNRTAEAAWNTAVQVAVNRLKEVIVTDGCGKDWCSGTDHRWGKCPNCGSMWDETLQCRVLPKT